MNGIRPLFKGRLNRRNFIFGILTSFGIVVAGFMLLGLLGKSLDIEPISTIANIVWLIVLVGIAIFSMSVYVRRWHDIGQTGWLVLLNLIPYVGLLAVLFLAIMEGQSKANKYGPVPSKDINFPADLLNSK